MNTEPSPTQGLGELHPNHKFWKKVTPNSNGLELGFKLTQTPTCGSGVQQQSRPHFFHRNGAAFSLTLYGIPNAETTPSCLRRATAKYLSQTIPCARPVERKEISSNSTSALQPPTTMALFNWSIMGTKYWLKASKSVRIA